MLSIVHNINSYFDCDPTINVTGVVLNTSKAFDKVWHNEILFKLENLSKLIRTCYQRVVLHGQTSTWELIKSGVPQWSVLGPLVFLININDLPDNIQLNCNIFADDTSLFSHVLDKDTSQDELNYDSQNVSGDWTHHWKTHFNPDPKKQAHFFFFFFQKR